MRCPSPKAATPPRHRFLEPIHNVKDGGKTPLSRPKPRTLVFISGVLLATARRWWSQSGSNRRPQACKASALPTELWPRKVRMFALVREPLLQMVGREGVEPSTSRLSGVRSNHLSYRPPALPALKPRAARASSGAHPPRGANDLQDEGT